MNPSHESASPASYVNQFGTGFISNGQIVDINFATVHSYPDSWVPNQGEAQKRAFMASWIKTHINDAKNRLNKPVFFAEVGQGVGYNARNHFDDMNVYARQAPEDRLQLAPQALKNNVQDKYVIVLSEDPTIANLMRKQSSRMSRLESQASSPSSGRQP